MNRLIILVFPLLFLLWTMACNRNENLIAEKKAEKHYATHCQSCHGDNVTQFAAHDWKYGRSRLQLLQSIKTRHEAAVLSKISEKDAMGLANFLMDGLVKAKEKEVNAGGNPPTNLVYQYEGLTVELDTIANGFDNPWGIAFLPGGELLVTDRSGDLYRIDAQRRKNKVKGVPSVLAEGQGGLLDVTLDPKFSENKRIYLSYSKYRDSADVKLSTTAVYRAALKMDSLHDGRDIFVAQPYFQTRHHYGSRIVFDKKGLLYISVGDRGKQNENPQNLRSDAGKIHRIYPDGHIPTDNPFYGDTGKARGTIWSYGHRNPQGLTFDPQTGELWETEHGPRGGDEINLILPGKNYGWPVISYGTHYSGESFTEITEKEGMEQPLYAYIPSIAPSGLCFVKGNRYPGWQGDLMGGSLRFQYLNRTVVNNQKIGAQEVLFKNIGRLRCVVMSPDDYLYIGVEEPGFVYRVKVK